MPRLFNKGFSSLVVIGLVAILFAAFFSIPILKQYTYLTYQDIGYKLGFNFNDIAQDKYVNWIKSQNDQKQSTTAGVFMGKSFTFEEFLASNTRVLGTSSNTGKWIDIDLSEQKLFMHEGDNIVGTFLVSTGKWAPTPTGQWPIWTKLRYTRMSGGSQALGTYYNLPNVPYTMYFNQGYGIHGAYWHNNFGQPMSHGCVNMRPEEAGIVFNWANVGTPVTVHN